MSKGKMKRRYMRDRKTITKRGGKRERMECVHLEGNALVSWIERK